MTIALSIGYAVLFLLFILHCASTREAHAHLVEDLEFEAKCRRDMDIHFAESFTDYRKADAGRAERIIERLAAVEERKANVRYIDDKYDQVINQITAIRRELHGGGPEFLGYPKAGLTQRHGELVRSVGLHTSRLERLESLTKPLAEMADKAKAQGKAEAKGAGAGSGCADPFVGSGLTFAWSPIRPNC